MGVFRGSWGTNKHLHKRTIEDRGTNVCLCAGTQGTRRLSNLIGRLSNGDQRAYLRSKNHWANEEKKKKTTSGISFVTFQGSLRLTRSKGHELFGKTRETIAPGLLLTCAWHWHLTLNSFEAVQCFPKSLPPLFHTLGLLLFQVFFHRLIILFFLKALKLKSCNHNHYSCNVMNAPLPKNALLCIPLVLAIAVYTEDKSIGNNENKRFLCGLLLKTQCCMHRYKEHNYWQLQYKQTKLF